MMGVQPHGGGSVALQGGVRSLDLVRLLIDALWIVFFIVASYGANPLRNFEVEYWAWLLADMAVLAMILLRADEVFAQVRRNLVMISWAALACASALWSLDPTLSFYRGLQLLLTVLLPLCLVMTTDLRRILILLLLAMMIAGVFSAFAEIGNGFGDEWRGTFPHKNVLGNMMAIAVITGVSLFLAGWRPYISGPSIIFALALLALSRSGTAIVATVIVLSLVPLAMTVRWGPIAVSIALGIVLIAAATGLIVLELLHSDPLVFYADVLDALGKDDTLSGRTILWQFAEDASDARPWLGYGYQGWWGSSETPANVLRLVMGQDLWYFHNTFLDLRVAFGVLGPFALIVGLTLAVYRSVRAFAQNPAPLLLWPIMFVVMSIIYCSVDFQLFVNHSFPEFLFVTAVAVSGDAVERTRRSAVLRQQPATTSQ